MTDETQHPLADALAQHAEGATYDAAVLRQASALLDSVHDRLEQARAAVRLAAIRGAEGRHGLGDAAVLLAAIEPLYQPRGARPTFTVFCQEVGGGGGTIWIGSCKADTPDDAAARLQAECASDWQTDVDEVHVLGVAMGDIEILQWEDQE